MADLKQQVPEKLVTISSLQEFFRDSVDAAMSANKVTVDQHTAYYIVNMLTMFSRSEALYESTDDGPTLKPLSVMYADAADASSETERNFNLQRLGDVSLFTAGFFADGLDASPVDMDYYVYMGGGAYYSLSVHMRASVRGRAFVDTFSELGQKFQDMVDVLNEVRESVRADTDFNVLQAYKLWLKTGSQRARRLLRNSGVIPLETSSPDYRH
jgi:hypothetical protein